MKDTLSALTMRQYIDVLCGDHAVLFEHGEFPSKQHSAEVVRRLVTDFARIADPRSAEAYLADHEDVEKDKALVLLFKVCANLCEMGAYADVRRILSEYGIGADTMTDDAVKREVRQQMLSAQSRVDRASEDAVTSTEMPTPSKIRESYDKQAAYLMTHFKFQIDLDVVTASQFAHMLAQADREIRAKAALYKK